MTDPRQKSIGITPQEKKQLENAKQLYENATGERSDWGKFLATASLLALGALGVYKLTKSSSSNSVVECPQCGIRFAVASHGSLPPIFHVQCPDCGEDVVVDRR